MKHIFVALIIVGFLSACGGGGGGGGEGSSSSASTAPANVTTTPTNVTTTPTLASQLTISTNISVNVYPPLYTAVAPTPVIDDTCLVTADSISYPESYKGALALPQVKGNFASANIGLGIEIKDHWAGDPGRPNPNLNKVCATDNRTAFTATLKRLKALGSSYVYIPQWACLSNGRNPSSFGQISISDADLIWMGQQAQAQGMKARLIMQVCSNDQQQNMLNNLTLDNQWYSTFFDTYSTFMLNQAQVAQTAGFDAMTLDWMDWMPTSWAQASSTRSARLQQLSVSIRQIFTGRQMLYSTWNTNDAPSGLVASVDLLIAMLSTNTLTPAQSNALSVSQLLPGFTNSINWRQFLGNGKPIIWMLQIQSHKDFFVSGWVEDGGCWATTTTCARSVTTDFSVQAIGIEAALEAINQQTFFKTESVLINSYWLSDTMTPHDSFPNTSQSIRNKPAESVVYQWWKK
jgi:hypothetical protein